MGQENPGLRESLCWTVSCVPAGMADLHVVSRSPLQAHLFHF